MKRIKLILFFCSISFLVFLDAYKNNFYQPVTINKWQELTWDDFQGTKRPFSRFAAGIFSTLYLDNDSLGNVYCYAGQNNQRSWTDDKSIYGLNHEQYHFNITEVFARRMNQFISTNPGQPESAYRDELKKQRIELRQMQSAYDDETNHSVNRSIQRFWEYRIDSLLITHSLEEEGFMDPYSGATIPFMFQKDFKVETGIEAGLAFRQVIANRYDLIISIKSYTNDAVKPESIFQQQTQMRVDGIEGFEIALYSLSGLQESSLKIWATTNLQNDLTFFQAFIYDGRYFYDLIVTPKSSSFDVNDYSAIVDSILKSFTIKSTTDYWLQKTIGNTTIVNDLTTHDPDLTNDCMVYKEIETVGVLANRRIEKQDTVIIPFQITKVADSLISKSVLLLENQAFSSDPNSDEHVFKIPKELLPDKPTVGHIGYFLKSDSTEACLQFYGQPFTVTKNAF